MMDNRRINDCFMKLARRAERVEREKLVATFVTTGPLVQILSSRDNQVIYGRRGTGKTHAMQYLADRVQEDGDFAIYIDMRTVGSNSSIYADHTLPIAERATRLLVDVTAEIHDALYEICIDHSDRFDLSRAGPAFDEVADAVSQLRVMGPTEVTGRRDCEGPEGIAIWLRIDFV